MAAALPRFEEFAATGDLPYSPGEALIDVASPYCRRRIGEILVDLGSITDAGLAHAIRLQHAHPEKMLGDLLRDQRLITASDLAAGLALQHGVHRIDPTAHSTDIARLDFLGPDFCLRHALLPLVSRGRRTVIATSRPDGFERMRHAIEATVGPVQLAISDEAAITATILDLRDAWLVARAESRPPVALSVRRWSQGEFGTFVALVALTFLLCLWTAPHATMRALILFAALMLTAMTALRVAAGIAHVRARPPVARLMPDSGRLPVISLLVPLLNESEISSHLLDRLAELDYPRHLLEIRLAVEDGDEETQRAVSERRLPDHVRIISVPRGQIRTKPRAMNYALDFCRGEIVGIYDAEDAPDPDQLRKIAAEFGASPPDVVCLQGQLGFYNPSQNWLARCFAIDYAAWFRVILPGLSRLGMAIPLGGTTVFFRRSALEALGRWDAHNVTEDADLGIRLARFGWRTRLIQTTTREEANCRVRPWIRQRARWLKGYSLTYAVHMRHPVQLWRDLGPVAFLGFQIMFLGTISLFLLAPLFWTFWVLPLGLPHPLAGALEPGLIYALAGLFVLSEIVNLAVAARAIWPDDRWLLPWIPTTIFYFPLAAIACYRAFSEIAVRPFFWDKTQHGLSLPSVRRRDRGLRRSGAGGFRTRD